MLVVLKIERTQDGQNGGGCGEESHDEDHEGIHLTAFLGQHILDNGDAEVISALIQAIAKTMMERKEEKRKDVYFTVCLPFGNNGDAPRKRRRRRSKRRRKHYVDVADAIAPQLAAVNETFRETGVTASPDEQQQDSVCAS